MADYSEAYNYNPPPPRFTPEERGTKYRWESLIHPEGANGRDEILARELMALEKVVKKLVEDFYTDKSEKPVNVSVEQPEDPTTWLEKVLELQTKVEVLEDQIEDLQTQLVDSETLSADLTDENDRLAAELDEANDKINEMRGILL